MPFSTATEAEREGGVAGGGHNMQDGGGGVNHDVFEAHHLREEEAQDLRGGQEEAFSSGGDFASRKRQIDADFRGRMSAALRGGVIIYKPGFNQNYYKSALIFLMKIVLHNKFHSTKFISYKCFHMRSTLTSAGGCWRRCAGG